MREELENFKPLKKQVLLVKHKQPEKSTAGLILNIYNDDHPNYGDVISVGEDVKNIFPGDVVVFNHYSGNRITFKDEELFFMPEDDILAKVTNGDAIL